MMVRIAGAASVVVAVLAAAAGLRDWPLLLFAAVVAAGGGTLLLRGGPGRSRLGWIAGGATTAAGLALAAFLPVRQGCCDAAYTFAFGLPLPWGTSSGDTPGLARATPDAVDALSAVADVVFWVHAGLIVAQLARIAEVRRAAAVASSSGGRWEKLRRT